MDCIVRFVHYSAHEFFKRERETRFARAQQSISTTCVNILCLHNLEEPEPPLDVEHLPFTDYAAEYLHKHFESTRHLIYPKEFSSQLRKLLQSPAKRRFYYFLLQKSQRYPVPSRDLTPGARYRDRDIKSIQVSSLHLAVFLGCLAHVKESIEIDSNVNELDGCGESPLVISIKRNFGDIASLLLDKGAVVDLSTREGHMVLLYLAEKDHHEAVDKILKELQPSRIELSLTALGVILLSPLLFVLVLRLMLGRPDLFKNFGQVQPTLQEKTSASASQPGVWPGYASRLGR